VKKYYHPEPSDCFALLANHRRGRNSQIPLAPFDKGGITAVVVLAGIASEIHRLFFKVNFLAKTRWLLGFW